jgi:dienelactone hydrolase
MSATEKTFDFSPSIYYQRRIDKTLPSLSYRGGDVATWQRRLRRKLKDLLGGPPGRRAALRTHSLWRRETGLGTIEKVVFTSQPGADAPAYVCLPRAAEPPYPFMICVQGHTSGMHLSIAVAREDEATPIRVENDEDLAVGCMARGIAALCIEQRCLGERKERALEKASKHGCLDATVKALMIGETLMAARVLDVDRGIDYLFTRRDADRERIGIIGNSVGGGAAMYSAALLPRIRFAMPSCYFCTFRDSLLAFYHCAENYVPALYRYADMADILGLFAPRPVVVVAGKDDAMYPVAGARKAFKRLQGIYRAAGAEDRCHLVVGDEGHRFYAAQAWPVMLGEIERIRR